MPSTFVNFCDLLWLTLKVALWPPGCDQVRPHPTTAEHHRISCLQGFSAVSAETFKLFPVVIEGRHLSSGISRCLEFYSFPDSGMGLTVNNTTQSNQSDLSWPP